MEINSVPSPALAVIDTRLPAAPNSGANPTDPAAVKKVAREFEAMFLAMTLKSMRATVGQDGSSGGGRGEETFRSLLDQEYATAAATSGGIGLAKMIEKELLRSQGGGRASGAEGGGDRCGKAVETSVEGGADAD